MAERLSVEKRVKCVRLFSVTGNVSDVCRQMKQLYGEPAPSRNTVARINKNFDETGSVMDVKKPGMQPTVVTSLY